ncbi:MAG: HRDC domain-containing protein, partial [Rhodothermales bacterium]
PETAQERRLFEALRNRRLELAREQGVPPYVIFHDRTLAEVARQRPQTEQDIGQFSGVGELKRERYGAAFREVIRAHDGQQN